MINYDTYNNVLQLVRNGDTITRAIQKCGEDRFQFYLNCTTFQKKTIQWERALQSKQPNSQIGVSMNIIELDKIYRHVGNDD